MENLIGITVALGLSYLPKNRLVPFILDIFVVGVL